MKNRIITSLAVLLVSSNLIKTAQAVEDSEGYIHVANRSEELLKILESLPYASEGSGPIIYTFEFSECSYCQTKYRDFNEADLGMEYRRFFVPVSDRTSKETAALGKSRDPADYHAYMRRQKVAPAFDQDNEAIDAYNAIVTAASNTIPTILKQNGWSARGLVFPTYLWIEDGKLFTQGGYLKDNYARAIERAKSGWNEASRAFYAKATGTSAPVAAAQATTAGASTATVQAPVANVSTPKFLDNLTVFMLYHKLSGEPIDFNTIAQNTNKVQRANQFDKATTLESVVESLKAAYEAADPDATYQIAVGGKLTYDINAERFTSDLFEEGVYLPFQAFSGGNQEYLFRLPNHATDLGRRVTFLNAANGLHLPLPNNQARLIDEVARSSRASVTAEMNLRFVDTVTSRIGSEKTLRAQVVSVKYNPGSITVLNKSNWPFQNPIPIEEATLLADESKLDRLDDATVFYAYHKLSGQPVEFDKFAGWMETVVRASQFDKASIQASEAAGMREEYDAVDIDKTYAININTLLTYDLENERFEVQFFEPGRHLLYRGLPALGVSGNHLRGNIGSLYQHKLFIANGDSARYISIPKAEATAIGDVARTGRLQASAKMELKLVGIGDPTGAVGGENIVRAEALSLVFDGIDLPVSLKPYDRNALKKVAVKDFNIMGMRVGQSINDLQKQIEKEFGQVGPIGPSRDDDPRFKSGIGHDPNGCYSFGNKVAEEGNICIRSYADEKGIIRKIVVEQILEGIEWEPIRLALLDKYGAMEYSAQIANVQHYAWGPKVAKSVTGDYQSQPAYTVSATLSVLQSALARSTNSTRASTNLRIRLIDPDWAGPPETTTTPVATTSSRPRL